MLCGFGTLPRGTRHGAAARQPRRPPVSQAGPQRKSASRSGGRRPRIGGCQSGPAWSTIPTAHAQKSLEPDGPVQRRSPRYMCRRTPAAARRRVRLLTPAPTRAPRQRSCQPAGQRAWVAPRRWYVSWTRCPESSWARSTGEGRPAAVQRPPVLAEQRRVEDTARRILPTPDHNTHTVQPACLGANNICMHVPLRRLHLLPPQPPLPPPPSPNPSPHSRGTRRLGVSALLRANSQHGPLLPIGQHPLPPTQR